MTETLVPTLDATGSALNIGDIVSRSGHDRQRIMAIGDYNDITVECIVAPSCCIDECGARLEPWCNVGDVELNMAGRYRLIERDPVDSKR